MDQVTAVSAPSSWLRVLRRVGGLVFLAFLVIWAVLLIRDRSLYVPVLFELALVAMVAVWAAEGGAAAWKRRGASSHPGFWIAWAAIDLVGAVVLAVYLAWRAWRLLVP
jgi:hypothetical protein